MDSHNRAPFLKVTLVKMVLFSTFQAYNAYLQQQAAFIAREGHRDICTDTSTAILGKSHAREVRFVCLFAPTLTQCPPHTISGWISAQIGHYENGNWSGWDRSHKTRFLLDHDPDGTHGAVPYSLFETMR